MWETWVRDLDWEDPLEKGKATHSNIVAWKIPQAVQSMGLQRVRHDWATFTHSLMVCEICLSMEEAWKDLKKPRSGMIQIKDDISYFSLAK